MQIYIYRLLINIITIFSPLIFLIRFFKKKEDLNRFKEKLTFFSKRRKMGKLIWFHSVSVGELLSIVPLIRILEKNKKISQILITSSTLTSANLFKQFNFSKTIHQFFPIDSNFLVKRFLNYWKPHLVVFIDSEIWPNMLQSLKRKNIPIILLNGRITKKTFNRWKIFPNFSKEVFSKFNLCLSSSVETKKYLKELGAKQIKYIGNLKFTQSENEKILINNELKKFISSKKLWCASSTHNGEEKFCGIVHKELNKKYKNLLTVIIPRHIERASLIKDELSKLNLKIHIHEPQKKIDPDTEIYIVNSYGKTKSFYSICKNVFLGGSLINHGGQNPLEATRYGCNILHGPNVTNFKEIFKYLGIKKISFEINNSKKMIKILNKLLTKNNHSTKKQKELSLIGKKILKFTYSEINLLLKNEF